MISEEWKQGAREMSFEERRALERVHETMATLAASLTQVSTACEALRHSLERRPFTAPRA